jgi:hypothetical protein
MVQHLPKVWGKMRRSEDEAEKFETDLRRLFSRLTWRLAQWASVPAPPVGTHILLSVSMHQLRIAEPVLRTSATPPSSFFVYR